MLKHSIIHDLGRARFRGGASCCLALLMLASATLAGAIETVKWKLADGFDHAVGRPDAKGYFKARGFWPNGHLGEDWNGNGGGDTDLGDPIYAIGHGVCVLSEDVKMGWGNVIILRHAFRDASGKIDMIDSLYGHLLERKLKVGDKVERGQLIAKMGNNNGMYPAHLHLEVHKNLAIGMNRSKFARDYSNYYSPTAFIESHRQLPAEFKKYEIPVNTFAKHGEDLNKDQAAFAANRPASVGGTGSGPASVGGTGSAPVKSGSGISIPITTSGGAKTGAVPKVTDKPKTATPNKNSPPAGTPPPDEKKDDFWARLKNKLKSGQVTDPSGRTPQ